MNLVRQPDGTITVEGVPIKEWYKQNSIVPTQSIYRGMQKGQCVMCLLTTLAYIELGKDSELLVARTGYQKDAPVYKKTSQLIADVLGIEHKDAKALEGGWSGEKLSQNAELYNLGKDAWEQAK